MSLNNALRHISTMMAVIVKICITITWKMLNFTHFFYFAHFHRL